MGVKGEELIFSSECDEPKVGRVLRCVYKIDFTPQNLTKMWNEAKKYRTLMGVEIFTEEQFVDFFLNKDGGRYAAKGLCARIDDFVGIFWLSDINFSRSPFDASIHYTFFDGRNRGRIGLCRDAIKYVFDIYGFDRLWTRVPVYIKHTLAFVEEIGFRKEGRVKDGAVYKGRKFDINLYALSKSEVLDNSAFTEGDRRKWVREQTIQAKSNKV